MTDSERLAMGWASEWLPRNLRAEPRRVASLAALLDRVRDEENEACAALVETERGKLGGRWSLDSAYLHQAIAAIRARSESKETPA